jgi:biotin synthase
MKIYELSNSMLESWLEENDPTRLEQLWFMANRMRERNVGESVFVRALVEFSNRCARSCTYCGLRCENKEVGRYRMTEDEILRCAHEAKASGCGTIVLQSGEDWGMDYDWFLKVVQRIRTETNLAVTASIGERTSDELKALRNAGADRYLLRFETSNKELFQKIHPNHPQGKGTSRIILLQTLRELGFEVGSGVMVGIPGQTPEDLLNDLLMIKKLDLDMVGIGPFVPHPDTPLGQDVLSGKLELPSFDRELTTYKMLALTRLLLQDANIPSTTALATINRSSGRALGLRRGANIVMPNFTPKFYRNQYSIYPEKVGMGQTSEDSFNAAQESILSVGRDIGVGRGDSIKFSTRVKG